MRYVCTSCSKERVIAVGAAWPSACECGGTTWAGPAATPLAYAGTFDPAASAKALLRQPGSPLDSFHNGGAVTSLT